MTWWIADPKDLASCEIQEVGGELQGKEQKTAKTKLWYVKSD